MRPSALSLKLVAGLAVLALATPLLPALVLGWKIAAAIFVVALIVDYWQLRRPPALSISRRVHHNLPLNVWSRVTLKLQHHGRRSLRLRGHDCHPGNFDKRGALFEISLNAGQRAEVSYEVRPLKRGDASFGGVDLIHRSNLGLWNARKFYTLVNDVKVYPNFAEVSRYILLATDNNLSQLGIKQRLRRGDGNDFLQLREYRAGDALRQIDWKVSARMHKLISREYQDERDQQIVFLLDCGRRMHHQSGELSHLDQTLNSMLLLSYVASNQGDAVGFLSFAGFDRWFAPMKGSQTVNRLLNRVYDIHSSTQSADYIRAASRLLGLQRKRSLVVVLTNCRDEDMQDLKTAIRLLQSRHLVMLADLREAVLDHIDDQPVATQNQAIDYLTVNDYRERRKRTHVELQGNGAYVLDVTAEQLPVAMVNQYFELKRSARI